jgi:pyruvate dehydrogenase E2 component (dihydrolipoamide acetyltransferase)
MPALGQASDELRLVAWLSSEGDEVLEGSPLFEVESDKTTIEVEATASGTLLSVLCQPDETVTAGTVIGWVGEPGEAVPGSGAPSAAGGEPRSAPAVPGAQATAGPAEPLERRPATPAARALARERGVDLALLDGSGPGGRIETRDVLGASAGAAAHGPSHGDEEPVPFQRQLIAKRLGRAALVPRFSLSKTLDATRAQERVARTEGATYTHLLLQAVAGALREFPQLDRVWVEDGPRYRRLGRGDVGLAIAVDGNLVVATVPAPDRLSLEELAQTTRLAVDQARAGRLGAAFVGPVAVTVSNLGMFGVDHFEAVVDPDQTAVLAVGQVKQRPVVTEEGIRAVPQLTLTLSVDHRVVDGADAARFVGAIGARFEAGC